MESVQNKRYFVLGDVHGEFGHLVRLMRLIRKNGFSFKNGDVLVQLGDRNDRGKDSFRVNNYFYKLYKRYPEQVVCIYGNHEDLMMKAHIDGGLFILNGGKATMKSYKCFTNNPNVLMYKLEDTGHRKWIMDQPNFYETDKYFFSHAPIPYEGMGARRKGEDFRDIPEVLYWSYGGENLDDWVDPEPIPGKISVHGHIHSMYRRKADGQYVSPGVRQIGNSFIVDTGAGCHPTAGYLTCLQLPEMIQYNSKGEILYGEYETKTE